jgi:hypothetical protein
MTPFQLLIFRQVLKSTGSVATAKHAAQNAVPGAKLRRRKDKLHPNGALACNPSCTGASAQADILSAVAALESEAVRRALSGVAVPVFHQGHECGSTIKHSDQLLMFLLKTLRPDRYGSGGTVSQTNQGRSVLLDIDLSAAQERAEQEEES